MKQSMRAVSMVSMVWLLAGTAACDADVSEGEGEGEGEPDPRATVLVDALVAARSSCESISIALGLGQLGVIEAIEPSFDSDAFLRELLTAGLQEQFSDDDLVIHQDAYDACLADVAACTPGLLNDASSCALIFTGVRALTEPCLEDRQCSSGVCSFAQPDDGCGVCVAPTALNEDCENAACAPGLACNFAGETGVCTAVLPAGASCTADFDTCADGLVCKGAGPTVCASAVVVAGEACSDTCGGVRTGFACVASVCVAVEVAAVGEACDAFSFDREEQNHCVDSSQGNNRCADPDGDGVGICMVLPTSGACLVVGEVFGEDFCSQDHVCLNDVCVAIPTVNEACDGTCADGLRCSEDNICLVTPGIGEPCVNFGCARGLQCKTNDICAEVDVPTCER